MSDGMLMNLEELFPDTGYEFRLRMERSEPASFFGESEAHADILAQRRHWIKNAPTCYIGLLPEGIPLLEQALEFAKCHGALPPGLVFSLESFELAWSSCLALGGMWEPDFLLLRIDPADTVRLVAGSVCFPSSWSLEEKMGHPIEAIHGVVPGLNASIGTQIHAFLSRLRPGAMWLRSNWGLTRSAELNQHPSRRIPRLDETVRLEEVWLRIENQALVALPRSKGVLFGIRVSSIPFRTIAEDRTLAPRVAKALETMPEEVASYKGLAHARTSLIGFLS